MKIRTKPRSQAPDSLGKAELRLNAVKGREEGFVYDAKAKKFVGHARGKADRVMVRIASDSPIDNGNLILLHNHPNGESFSPFDVEQLFKQGFKESRVVAGGRVYTLSGKGVWKDLRPKVEKARDEVEKGAGYWHRVWDRVLKGGGLSYTDRSLSASGEEDDVPDETDMAESLDFHLGSGDSRDGTHNQESHGRRGFSSAQGGRAGAFTPDQGKDGEALSDDLYAHSYKWWERNYQRPGIRDAAVAYQSFNGDRPINGPLRANGGDRGHPFPSRLEKLDALISDADPLPETIMVWRGAEFPEIAEALRNGEDIEGLEFQDHGYVSTSTRPATAKAFTRQLSSDNTDKFLVRIEVSKGEKVAFMDRVKNAGEDEVLLPRGGYYEVRKYHKGRDEVYDPSWIEIEYLGVDYDLMEKAPREPANGQKHPPERFGWKPGDVVWGRKKDLSAPEDVAEMIDLHLGARDSRDGTHNQASHGRRGIPGVEAGTAIPSDEYPKPHSSRRRLTTVEVPSGKAVDIYDTVDEASTEPQLLVLTKRNKKGEVKGRIAFEDLNPTDTAHILRAYRLDPDPWKTLILRWQAGDAVTVNYKEGHFGPRAIEAFAPHVVPPGTTIKSLGGAKHRVPTHKEKREKRASFLQEREKTEEGAPVKNAIITGTGKAGDIADRALKAIDKVHTDGALPRIPVRGSGGTRRGATFYQNEDNSASRIIVNTGGLGSTKPHLAFVHEVGHFLDNDGMGTPRKWTALREGHSEEMDTLTEFIRESDAVKNLQRLHRAARYREDRDFARYLLERKELFARAYSQWVATKSGDPRLKEELKRYQNKMADDRFPQLWTDEDFELISEAMDDLFKKLGWLK